MKRQIATDSDMQALGHAIGRRLRGGECIELVGDVGVGKTTFMKGIGAGLGVAEEIQSPSFTISRVYPARDNLRLEHYDFYRLSDAGIMSFEINESLQDPRAVTAIEWAATVSDVLPSERVIITISYQPEGDGRLFAMRLSSAQDYLAEAL